MAVLENREIRIRRRLDVVRDERDAALDEMWVARAEVEKLESRIDAVHRANRELRRSREMWRERAKGAEEMVNQMNRAKKRSRKT